MSAAVGILLSGRGSNFVALHRAMAANEVPAEIALVVSNRAEAPGLAKAGELGLATVCIPHQESATRREHDERVLAALRGAGVEWICLAGYMRLLSADFVANYSQRILNIHPSLLPSFPGLHVQKMALEWGVRVAGCTVHLVDEELDHGPIVVQHSVEVDDEDDEESLSARILIEEHKAYPEALRRLLTEKWRVEGRRIVWKAA